MTRELQDMTAVVTGASKGIGLAVAEALAAAGADVVAAARTSSPGLDVLVKEAGARWVPLDLTEPDSAGQLVAAAGDRIDVLVNNVGSAPARPGGFLSVTDAQWRQTLELNLFATIAVTRAVLPRMLEAGRGSIVNIGSVNAELPDPTVVDYSATKAALVNFSKALSKEFGPRGVRVNSVSPGPVETDLWLGGGGVADTVSAAAGLNPQDVLAQAAAATVSGRFSRASEIADLVVFLAGDRAANIVGSDLRIDGGFVPTW
ncbi:SDR family NAD(P)-dependent oxidoreductase [Streptomyces griseorubiginosus]|uniref:SDR family NAD(P)-dependent oxidoreductase n=1 Tax=Streptomyces griseorubiginosus TaxID=67304 RepID=UPI001AD72F6F|nr:SDR family oxidoreductase [Streptomyces griseorubiginosus]MBO4252438.1 SDR family oxidoreductase [Streptomyces griseorubiginosus]